jgi:hypothetical protein
MPKINLTDPATSLADARGRAIEARSLVESGIDPRDIRTTNPASMTVADLVKSYIAKHVRTLRSKKDREAICWSMFCR